MARGWESKSVEAQQADAAEKQTKSRPPLTVQQAKHQRELEGLRLARHRVLQQLQANLNPRYRKLLQEELADLDSKLLQLGAPAM
jgi:septal ring factor EnvC (AmiA/AmiB activator)